MSNISLLLTFILSFPYSVYSQNLADTASIYVTEYNKICTEIDKKVWGISLDVPIMFVDSTNDFAYLSHPLENVELKKYKDIFIYPLEVNHEISVPIMEWNGLKWVVVHLPFSGSTKELMAHIAHEAFHIIQVELSILGSLPSFAHLNTLEGKFLMHMEIVELHKALGNPNKAKEYLSNAVSIRNYRNYLFPKSYSIETQAELNEGLAEYTGYVYAQYSKTELLKQYENFIENLEENVSMTVAVYPYLSGSLYAFLNDIKSNKWKVKINKKNIHEITVDLYQLENIREIKSLNDSLFNKEDSQHILHSFRENVYQQEQFDSLFNNNILVLDLTNSEVQIKSNVTVAFQNFGTIYNNVIIDNEWGRLKVNKEGRVLISSEDKLIKLNADSLSMDSKFIKGINWELILDENYRINKRGKTYFLESK